MKNIKILRRASNLIPGAVLLASIGMTALPNTATAAAITNRKLTLGSSAPSAVTSYTFDFTTATTATFQSFSAQICTTASGTCTAPSGLTTTTSTLTSSSLSGTWTVNNGSAGTLRGSASGASSTTSGSARQVAFGNVTNPSATNTAYYARVTLYSDTGWATPVDEGTVAASTATQILLSGTMDESLVFCAGTSITGTNCATIAGSSVNFGTFSSTATSSGTSVMAASTNGSTGYAITMNGATLTSGANTITALGSQAASSVGTAQFGANLRSNTTPSVGADPAGSGSGSYTASYGTANQFKFTTGDSVASASTSTSANAYTVSYMVNVPGSQPPGTYSAVMTYIATAVF